MLAYIAYLAQCPRQSAYLPAVSMPAYLAWLHSPACLPLPRPPPPPLASTCPLIVLHLYYTYTRPVLHDDPHVPGPRMSERPPHMACWSTMPPWRAGPPRLTWRTGPSCPRRSHRPRSHHPRPHCLAIARHQPKGRGGGVRASRQ